MIESIFPRKMSVSQWHPSLIHPHVIRNFYWNILAYGVRGCMKCSLILSPRILYVFFRWKDKCSKPIWELELAFFPRKTQNWAFVTDFEFARNWLLLSLPFTSFVINIYKKTLKYLWEPESVLALIAAVAKTETENNFPSKEARSLQPRQGSE